MPDWELFYDAIHGVRDPDERPWNPRPGDRVLIRNAGEYGWNTDQVRAYFSCEEYRFAGGRTIEMHGLSRVIDERDGRYGEAVTVLRSDLSPVEPQTSLGRLAEGRHRRSRELDRAIWGDEAPLYDTRGTPFERHTSPETEETRRLTKEDYSDVAETRLEGIVAEWLFGQLEAIDPKLAESYRARTRKEGK